MQLCLHFFIDCCDKELDVSFIAETTFKYTCISPEAEDNIGMLQNQLLLSMNI